MPPIANPLEKFTLQSTQSMLLIGVLSTALVSVLHYLQPDPPLLNLLVPPLLCLTLSGLLIYLYQHPAQLVRVIWIGFFTAIVAIAVPAWYFVWRAWRSPGGSLVDSLPPITIMLVPIILVVILFLRPRPVLIAAVAAWVLVASPILAYLAFHPRELWSPRGMDMVITLGPLMLLILTFIPFHRGIEMRMLTLQRDRSRMQALAQRDVLTDLYNRRAGESFLAEFVEQAEAGSELILIDIDRFKSINDRFGHAAGDEVLRKVARRCEAQLGRDDLLMRWGGEEFLVLLRASGNTSPTCGAVAERLRAALAAEPIDPVGRVTASFGVTRPRAGDSAATLLQRADQALYAAKEGGRNAVVIA